MIRKKGDRWEAISESNVHLGFFPDYESAAKRIYEHVLSTIGKDTLELLSEGDTCPVCGRKHSPESTNNLKENTDGRPQ